MVSKGICQQDLPEFGPPDPHGGRGEPIPEGCSLIYTYPYTHTAHWNLNIIKHFLMYTKRCKRTFRKAALLYCMQSLWLITALKMVNSAIQKPCSEGTKDLDVETGWMHFTLHLLATLVSQVGLGIPPASQHGVLIQSAVTDVLSGCFTSWPCMESQGWSCIIWVSFRVALKLNICSNICQGLFRFLYLRI